MSFIVNFNNESVMNEIFANASFQGKENLVLPLVILGAISVIGGLSGLRLPETLHHRLPQTIEEGELFGKNWTCADCVRCIPTKYALRAHTINYYQSISTSLGSSEQRKIILIYRLRNSYNFFIY